MAERSALNRAGSRETTLRSGDAGGHRSSRSEPIIGEHYATSGLVPAVIHNHIGTSASPGAPKLTGTGIANLSLKSNGELRRRCFDHWNL